MDRGDLQACNAFDFQFFQSSCFFVILRKPRKPNGVIITVIIIYAMTSRQFHRWKLVMTVLQPNAVLCSEIQATKKNHPSGFNYDTIYDTNNILCENFAVEVLVICSCA